MARAPLLLQQSLLFPYREGLGFEQAMLVKAGTRGGLRRRAGASAVLELRDHPSRCLYGASAGAGAAPAGHPSAAGRGLRAVRRRRDGRARRAHARSSSLAARRWPSALAPAWNGRHLLCGAAQVRATAAEKESTASLGLVYYSRWENADSARSFRAHLCRAAAAQVLRRGAARSRMRRTTDEQVYTHQRGRRAVCRSWIAASSSREGFALPLARKLRDSDRQRAAGGAGAAVRLHAGRRRHGELTLWLSRYLASFGDRQGATQLRDDILPAA